MHIYNLYGNPVEFSRIQNPVEHGSGDSSQKSQKSFIVDVQLGAKYASRIGFTVEKFKECQ